ncbi:hypothetical protein JL100_018100 [Skermanella mucosa]|uniref:hypothetical protein n=1 Tax=Skermanella mucosa TaxID=1789672 RepID=UPI00192B4799|nr:hypothetical protein [Skermanella mucosa]UEM18999.1 hypothetical protein JL100_018100 [Skermanella mucosa]
MKDVLTISFVLLFLALLYLLVRVLLRTGFPNFYAARPVAVVVICWLSIFFAMMLSALYFMLKAERNLAPIVFVAPSEMEKEESQPVRVTVSARAPAFEIERRLLDEGQSGIDVETLIDRVQTEMVMAAELAGGQNFDVEPKGVQHREFGVVGEAEWHWRITALKQGEHWLTLRVYSLAPNSPGTLPRYQKVLERQISVKVTGFERVISFINEATGPVQNIQALYTVLIVPVLGAIYAGYRWFTRPVRRSTRRNRRRGDRA